MENAVRAQQRRHEMVLALVLLACVLATGTFVTLHNAEFRRLDREQLVQNAGERGAVRGGIRAPPSHAGRAVGVASLLHEPHGALSAKATRAFMEASRRAEIRLLRERKHAGNAKAELLTRMGKGGAWERDWKMKVRRKHRGTGVLPRNATSSARTHHRVRPAATASLAADAAGAARDDDSPPLGEAAAAAEAQLTDGVEREHTLPGQLEELGLSEHRSALEAAAAAYEYPDADSAGPSRTMNKVTALRAMSALNAVLGLSPESAWIEPEELAALARYALLTPLERFLFCHDEMHTFEWLESAAEEDVINTAIVAIADASKVPALERLDPYFIRVQISEMQRLHSEYGETGDPEFIRFAEYFTNPLHSCLDRLPSASADAQVQLVVAPSPTFAAVIALGGVAAEHWTTSKKGRAITRMEHLGFGPANHEGSEEPTASEVGTADADAAAEEEEGGDNVWERRLA